MSQRVRPEVGALHRARAMETPGRPMTGSATKQVAGIER